MSLMGMFNKAGYEASGVFMKHLLTKGFIPVVLKSEVSDHAASDTTTYVDGTSLALGAKILKAGRTLRITVGGTIAGANGAKAVTLYIDDGRIGVLTLASATVGNFWAQWNIFEYTDYAHQLVHGVCVAGTNAGATGIYAVDSATDTTNFAIAKTIKTEVYSAHASDTITQKWCIFEMLPYA